jgi:hypothetical protein
MISLSISPLRFCQACVLLFTHRPLLFTVLVGEVENKSLRDTSNPRKKGHILGFSNDHSKSPAECKFVSPREAMLKAAEMRQKNDRNRWLGSAQGGRKKNTQQ